MSNRHVTAIVAAVITVILTFTGVASYSIVSNQNNNDALNGGNYQQVAQSEVNNPPDNGGAYFQVCSPGDSESMVFYWDSTPASLLANFPSGTKILVNVPVAQMAGGEPPAPMPCP